MLGRSSMKTAEQAAPRPSVGELVSRCLGAGEGFLTTYKGMKRPSLRRYWDLQQKQKP